MAKVDINNLAAEITLALREYTTDVTDGILDELDSTSKEMVKQLRANSPKRANSKNKARQYAKGWTRKKVGRDEDTSYIVYNKNKPGLAHLLEKGHAKRNGGRVDGRPHIRPVSDRLINAMEKNIERIIRNGG